MHYASTAGGGAMGLVYRHNDTSRVSEKFTRTVKTPVRSKRRSKTTASFSPERAA